ncbi:MAG: hypothetical protein IK083_09565 [Abditibacteriota bacterium]|nr:hypothetical protein [Abditibacteriota bacterium]
MAVIRIKVDGHLAQCVSVEPMATGSAGVDSVIIDRLGGDWDGFGLAAAFKTEGGVYYSVVTDGSAPIPAAALAYKRFGIALYGTRGAESSEQRYTTNFVPVAIPEGSAGGGAVPPEPSERLYSQVVAIAEHAESVEMGCNRIAAEKKQKPMGRRPEIIFCLALQTLSTARENLFHNNRLQNHTGISGLL